MRKLRLKKQIKSLDKRLLALTLLLTGVGLVAVADASAPVALKTFGDRFYFAKQQAVWAGIGLFSLIIFSKIKYTFWEKFAIPAFILGMVLLVLVLIPGVGLKALGARRWFSGPIPFQPSEFVKLALALYLAKLAAKDKPPLAYLIPLFAVAALIMMQPDLGTTIIMMGIGISQIFVSGISLVYFVGATLFAAVGSLILIFTSDYRRDRFLTFLRETQDPLGKAYHIGQVLIALGAGGLWGVGLGASRQKYLFLPEAATDSIFAVIAEEVGFIGACVLIAIFAAFIYRVLSIAKNAPDTFSRVLSIGIMTWIGGQAILNFASMVALTPLTGIPLPFLSYGGSSLVSVLMATGILLNISRYEEKTK